MRPYTTHRGYYRWYTHTSLTRLQAARRTPRDEDCIIPVRPAQRHTAPLPLTHAQPVLLLPLSADSRSPLEVTVTAAHQKRMSKCAHQAHQHRHRLAGNCFPSNVLFARPCSSSPKESAHTAQINLSRRLLTFQRDNPHSKRARHRLEYSYLTQRYS